MKKSYILKNMWLCITYFFWRHTFISTILIIYIVLLTNQYIEENIPTIFYIYNFALSIVVAILIFIVSKAVKKIKYHKIGNGLTINRWNNKILMVPRKYNSANDLYETFINELREVPDKYLTKNVTTFTHHSIILGLLCRIQGRRYPLLEKEKTQYSIIYNGKKYVLNIIYRKDRYLYEAAHMNTGLKEYLKTNKRKKEFYDVEIPYDLILELKRTPV